jgi:hypothetical protein
VFRTRAAGSQVEIVLMAASDSWASTSEMSIIGRMSARVGYELVDYNSLTRNDMLMIDDD